MPLRVDRRCVAWAYISIIWTLTSQFRGAYTQITGVDHSTPSSTSKAGMAWANGNQVDFDQFAVTGKVTWYYSWSVWPLSNIKSNLEHVPMYWGPRVHDEFTSRIESVIRRSKPEVTAIIGMNEPELSAQSDITPEDAVRIWRETLEPLRSAHGVRLGSPGVSSSPAGKLWLQDFFRLCDGECNVDFIPLHWYGTEGDAFIAHLWDYFHTFNRTIWVTEWACHNFVDLDAQCTPDGVMRFMNQTQAFMDNSTFVERYSWFGAMRDLQGVNPANALMDDDGKINDLGRQYIGYNGPEDVVWSSADTGKQAQLAWVCAAAFSFSSLVSSVLAIG